MSKLKQFFLTIAIGLALAAGLSYAWTGPTATPPNNNASAPINVSVLGQIKTGALQVNGFRNIGSSIFVGSSIFDGLATFNSSIKIPTGAGTGKVLTSDAEGKASWDRLKCGTARIMKYKEADSYSFEGGGAVLIAKTDPGLTLGDVFSVVLPPRNKAEKARSIDDNFTLECKPNYYLMSCSSGITVDFTNGVWQGMNGSNRNSPRACSMMRADYYRSNSAQLSATCCAL